jgi:FKBP-type peptidyl-prolyl cis-trans isomerase
VLVLWLNRIDALMSFSTCILLVVLVTITISCRLALASSTDLKVIVYDGPRECSNNIGGGSNKGGGGGGGGGRAADDTKPPTKIEPGMIVGLHFTVSIDESSIGTRDVVGRKIESSRDGAMPVAPSFPVGQGRVITGLDRGLIGLCKGSRAHIVVPPHLGYGIAGKPEQGVWSDTTLRYDVEILDIRPAAPNDFVKIDTNKDWEISIDEAREYFEKLGQEVNYDKLWKDEDEDGDGYISWDEFKGPKGGEGPPPKKMPKNPHPNEKKQQQHHHDQQQQQQQQETIEMLIDTDKDGKISKAELAYAFGGMGGEMTEEFWDEADPDGDGYVTYEEFTGSSSSKASESGEEL